MSTIGPPHPGKLLAYGTAGFRARAEVLDSTFFRMGMLAVLRSRACNGLAIGLMVTASHNPEPDNGIKLIDADGGMLDQSWEVHATALANAPDAELTSMFSVIAKSVGLPEQTPGKVLIARDTRQHSGRLARLALEGIAHVDGQSQDYGLLTTPQLHHIVRHANGVAGGGPHVGPIAWASEAGYYDMLATAYSSLVPDMTPRALWVDGAGGIGAPKLTSLEKRMGGQLVLTIANKVGECELNQGCGAEFVQKGRAPPRGFEVPPEDLMGACSVDGDADRLVYHYWRKHAGGAAEWRLLDGDKIAALYATFLCELLAELNLQNPLSTAVVQTAYANGASGAYISSLGVNVRMAKTGVKYVHHVALEHDISIYFEANGHGTVLFSDAAVDAILGAKADAEQGGDAVKLRAANQLLFSRQLINQAIGDAISDLLLVEAILALKGWSVATWDALYEDLPSRQAKLAVADRTAITTTGDETRATAPLSLQPELDQLAAKFEKGRCFVRPSGTEDVVRVYAEASTQADADALATQVAQATWRLAGGVGVKP